MAIPGASWRTLLAATALAACGEGPAAVPQKLELLAGHPLQGIVRMVVLHDAQPIPLPFQIDPRSLPECNHRPHRCVGLRVDDGWLVGSSAGEWGGGVRWYSPAGTRSTLLVKENCIALVSDGSLALCVCGTSHGTRGYGRIYAFARDPQGWSLQRTIVLPGCPRSVRLGEDHSLLLPCHLGYDDVLGKVETFDFDNDEALRKLDSNFDVTATYRAGSVSY